MDRAGARRLLPVVLVAGGLVAWQGLARRWPTEQTVHYVLGDAAPRVAEVEARWADVDGTPLHAVTFRYVPGMAPRVLTHQLRLANGDYDVEVEIHAKQLRAAARRRVSLGGGATSIDVSTLVPLGPERGAGAMQR